MTNDGDQIAMATSLHPQDAKTVLGVMEGDSFNQARDDLAIGGR
jgi:hypothetical protein